MSLMLGNDRLSLRLTTSDESPVQVEAFLGLPTPPTPLVEVLVLGEGRAMNQTRGLTRTSTGQTLRYAGHHLADDGADVVWQRSTDGALATETRIAVRDGSLSMQTTLANTGDADVVIESLTAGILPLPLTIKSTDLITGQSSWCAENRWRTERLEAAGLVDCGSARMAVPGSASISRVGRSTWTTDGPLPVGVLQDNLDGDCIAWQIAGGGAWRWELDSTEPGRFLLAASGATHLDHGWSATLRPGDNVTTPELIVTRSQEGWDGAVRELTGHRRSDAAERTTPLGRTALVFNDYMNTLMADPTTEKLLPLIAAAADAGAEVFCIDAGWYDDSGDWWPSVGEWLPSTTRFGDLGLQGILDTIREHGMLPGLWLEPEVVGVRSPLVEQLPPSAFLRRRGRPIVEHSRYFLDLRSPAARAHLDATFDRLIAMGARFFKLDYNVTPGLGADTEGIEPGGGLRAHIDAYFSWFDALRERHPSIVIENCGSGAMRQDWAQVSRFDLQSTSDQQDPLLYPPIAAGAPMMLLPEQAGNWAYAQPEMTDEEIAFVHVTGLSGRPYFSGHLDRMTDAQLALVREAAELWKAIRDDVVESVPFWPTGLPSWSDDVVSLGLLCPDDTAYVAVWNRSDEPRRITLHLLYPHESVTVTQAYPTGLPHWEELPAGEEHTVVVEAPAGPTARLLRITPS